MPDDPDPTLTAIDVDLRRWRAAHPDATFTEIEQAVDAQERLGPGTAATSEWFATQRHELRHGDPDRVLAALPPSPGRDTRSAI